MISSAKFSCKLQSSVLWGFSGTILFNDFIADLRDGTGVHCQQVCEWPETGGGNSLSAGEQGYCSGGPRQVGEMK